MPSVVLNVMLFIYNIIFPFARFVKLRKTVHQLNFFSCVKECMILHSFNGFILLKPVQALPWVSCFRFEFVDENHKLLPFKQFVFLSILSTEI